MAKVVIYPNPLIAKCVNVTVKSGDTLSFYEQKTFKLEDIFPLSKVSFYDFTVSAPKEVESHLLSLYGEGFMKSAYKQWAANKSKFKITDFSAAKVEKCRKKWLLLFS